MFEYELAGGFEGLFELGVDGFDGATAEEGVEFASGFCAVGGSLGVGFFEVVELFFRFGEACGEGVDGDGFLASERFGLGEGFCEGVQLVDLCFELGNERLGLGGELFAVVGMGGEQGFDGGFEGGKVLGEFCGTDVELLLFALQNGDLVGEAEGLFFCGVALREEVVCGGAEGIELGSELVEAGDCGGEGCDFLGVFVFALGEGLQRVVSGDERREGLRESDLFLGEGDDFFFACGLFCLVFFELVVEGGEVGLSVCALVFVVIEGFSSFGELAFEGIEKAGGGVWVGVDGVGVVGRAADGAGVPLGEGGAEGGGLVSGGGSGLLKGCFGESQFGLCGGDGGGLELFEDGLAFGAALLEGLAVGAGSGEGGLSAEEFTERGEGTYEVLLFGVACGECVGRVLGFG